MARGTGSTPMMDITAKLRRIINARADMARRWHRMDIEAGRRKKPPLKVGQRRLNLVAGLL
jgi:hypothetical protein